MNKTKLIIYVISVLTLAFFVTFFVFYGKKLVFTSGLINQRDTIIALKESVKYDDYKLYWIGDVPSRLKDLNISVLDKNTFTEEDLPLRHIIKPIEYREKDEDGKERVIVKQTFIEQECPDYSFIIINNVGDIPAEKRQLFQRCAVDSNTVILVIGKNAVDSYRAYLFRPVGIGFDFSSMIVHYNGNETMDVLDADRIKDPESVDFTLEFLDFLSKKLGH